MQHAAGVSGGQATPGGDQYAQHLVPPAWLSQPIAQRTALDELHGDEQRALVRADVIRGDHVLVRQASEHLRLLQQPPLCLRLQRPIRRRGMQQLERNVATELSIVGAVYRAAAARTDHLEHLVAADSQGRRHVAR
jgi:hypothetical protein